VKEVWEEGKEKREEKAGRDEEVARELNRLQYEKEGQLVECCCCFGEEPWEEMGACGEGHLVCRRVETPYFPLSDLFVSSSSTRAETKLSSRLVTLN